MRSSFQKMPEVRVTGLKEGDLACGVPLRWTTSFPRTGCALLRTGRIALAPGWSNGCRRGERRPSGAGAGAATAEERPRPTPAAEAPRPTRTETESEEPSHAVRPL